MPGGKETTKKTDETRTLGSESSSEKQSNDSIDQSALVQEQISQGDQMQAKKDPTAIAPAPLPSKVELLAQMLAQPNFVGHKADDATLLGILKDTFNSNWFYAKDLLTMDKWPPTVTVPPIHANSIALMQALVDMRGRQWDVFAKGTVGKIKAEVAAKKASNPALAKATNPDDVKKNLEIKESVGSQSVTSDIDLSLGGENTELGVALLNAEFKKHFGVTCEPGTMFDINVYSSDWMFGGTEVAGTPGVATYVPKEEEVLSEAGKATKNDQNEVWSLVKIRRNMTPTEWKAYTAETIGDLNESEKAPMQKQFDAANLEYAAFEKSVSDLAAQMEAAADHELDHYEKESIRMSASNRLYEEKILRVKELRVQIKALKEADKVANAAQIEKLALELHNKISEGLTYANEVYATQGAVLHTVYGKQGAKKKLGKLNSTAEADAAEVAPLAGVAKGAYTGVEYKLTDEMYLQSVNENVGDSLHSLNHFADDPEYAAYRAGKYLDRLCEAAEKLFGEEEVSTMANYPYLKEVGTNSVKEKDKEAGKDPMSLKTNKSSFFYEFKASDLAYIRGAVMSFGASITAKVKNKPKVEAM